MAGTTPLSLVQQFDATGAPLALGLLYFYVAGTVATPQNVFQDFGLTIPLANPLTLDSTGRVPQHWLADGLIHIRLIDVNGDVQVDTTMQVLGPSSGGGGGGGTVDPTAIFGTGDEKTKYGTGPISGWVRENGLTIGSATSGATERANADTQALFVYLYTTDPNLVVSGGRGLTALGDFNANKTIALPDMRGKGNGGLADMGNTATAALTATYFGASVTTLGASGGSQSATLETVNLPPYTPAGTVSPTISGGSGPQGLQSGTGGVVNEGGTGSGGTNVALSIPPVAIAGTPQNGTSTPFATLPPMSLKTFYIKL
jgi:hypothetical protein